MSAEKVVKVRADTGLRGWDAKPFTVRNPDETCFTCRYASKERTGPADLMGQVVCKWGPKHLTSLPQSQGIIGVAGHPAVRPEEWCYRWDRADALDGADGAQTVPVIAS